MFKIFIDKEALDNDVSLTLDDNTHVIDSYHYVIDQDDESAGLNGYDKLVFLMKKLFFVWVDTIEKGYGFLPFDFSDQYLGGFLVSSIDVDTIKLDYGYYEDLYGWLDGIIATAKADHTHLTFIIDNNFKPIIKQKDALIRHIRDELIGGISSNVSK